MRLPFLFTPSMSYLLLIWQLVWHLEGSYCHPGKFRHKVYSADDKVTFQCKNSSGSWGPAPICADTQKELSFTFAKDEMISCHWKFDETNYEFMKRLILRQDSWNCRVAMTKEEKPVYIPFTIPIWGVVEQDHIHIDNHINFVFHIDSGFLIGATAYPVRDVFQMGKLDTTIHMHGAIRWFKGQSFVPVFNNLSFGLMSPSMSTVVLIIWVIIITFHIVLVVFLVCYAKFLKPRVIQQITDAKKQRPPSQLEEQQQQPPQQPLGVD